MCLIYMISHLDTNVQLIKKYFGPSHAYNIDEEGNLYEEKLAFKSEPQKDNYVEHIRTIVKTLEELI